MPLEENKFYHIYNRGNNRENLFYNHGNYEYFLRKYDEYFSEYLETYAFCLLPNHFHLLVSVKEKPLNLPSFHERASIPINEQFRRLFITYAQAINKQENRVGSLFQKPFKRKEVNNQNYLVNLVFYIHANPQIHGVINDYRMYPWSSYGKILDNKPSRLKRDTVIEWFDDKNNFIAFHNQKLEHFNSKDLMLE